MEILLGSGNDTFEIDSTSSGTITAIHGGGGKDRITAAGYGGPLVIYGDTDAKALRYSGSNGTPSENGHWFNNADGDYIDLSSYLHWAAVYGGPGEDQITGTGFADCLAGGPDSDWIDGGCGDDLIYGDSGFNVNLRDRLLRVYNTGTAGSDFLDGGYGDDIIFGDYGVPCYLSLSKTKLDTKRVKIQTQGSDGSGDYILGGSGDDVLIGGPGCDTIDGQEGNDLIFGDNAIENPYYNLLPLVPSPSLQVFEVVVISYTNYAQQPGSQYLSTLAGNSQDWWTILLLMMHSLSLEEVPLNDFENLVVIRYTRYTKEPNHQYLSIIVRPDDSAVWWAELPLMLKTDRYGDDDYLAGGPGNEAIFGQSGNDTIQGDGSVVGTRVRVRINNGQITEIYPSISAVTDGDDYIEGGSGNDTILGNLGNDDIVGGSSNLFCRNLDKLPLDGEDIIFGGSGTNVETISQAENPTSLNKGDDDAIIGGNGNIYRILFGDQATVLFLNPNSGAVSHRAFEPLNYNPLKGDLYIIQKSYNPAPGDVIHGEWGNDFIHGMAKDDFLYGEAGNDQIIGGSGYDKIFGGSGQNQIIQDDF